MLEVNDHDSELCPPIQNNGNPGTTKHCKWSECNSDSRYAHRKHMKNVTFIHFPKPCSVFSRIRRHPHLERNDVEWQHHKITDCEACSRCQDWVRKCGVENFTMFKVTKNSFICSKHFLGGFGPTQEHPDPISNENETSKVEEITEDSIDHGELDISIEVEEKLWKAKEIGTDNPQAILLYFWIYLFRRFGLVCKNDHARLTFSQIVVKQLDNGSKQIDFLPKPDQVCTINNPLQTPTDPRRCPVAIYEAYVSRRPASTCQNYSPFYLQPERDTGRSQIWFTAMALGRNKLPGILSLALKRVGHPLPLAVDMSLSNGVVPSRKGKDSMVVAAKASAIKLKITNLSAGKPIIVDTSQAGNHSNEPNSVHTNGDIPKPIGVPTFRKILPRVITPAVPLPILTLTTKPEPEGATSPGASAPDPIIRPKSDPDTSDTQEMEDHHSEEVKDKDTEEAAVPATPVHRYNTRQRSGTIPPHGTPGATKKTSAKALRTTGKAEPAVKRSRAKSGQSNTSRSPVARKRVKIKFDTMDDSAEKETESEVKMEVEEASKEEDEESMEDKPVSSVSQILSNVDQATDSVTNCVTKAKDIEPLVIPVTIAKQPSYRILTSLLQNSSAETDGQPPSSEIKPEDAGLRIVNVASKVSEETKKDPECIDIDEEDQHSEECRPGLSDGDLENLKIDLRKSTLSPGRSVKLEIKSILGMVSGSGGERTPQQVTDLLWQVGALGDKGPWLLVFTMWWMIQNYIGVGSRMNHVKLHWGDIRLRKEDDEEYLEYQGPENYISSKAALMCKRLYSRTSQKEGEGPDFVHLYKIYSQRRLTSSLNLDSPFYLQPLQGSAMIRQQQVWFGESPLGKNRIGALMRNIVEKVVRPALAKTNSASLIDHAAALNSNKSTSNTSSLGLATTPPPPKNKIAIPPEKRLMSRKPPILSYLASQKTLSKLVRSSTDSTLKAEPSVNGKAVQEARQHVIQLVHVSPASVIQNKANTENTNKSPSLVPVESVKQNQPTNEQPGQPLKPTPTVGGGNKSRPRPIPTATPLSRAFTADQQPPEPRPDQLKTLAQVIEESISYQSNEFPEHLRSLWSRGVLGSNNPWSLNFSTWFINTLVFGVESRNEHLRLKWGDFRFGRTTVEGEEREFVYFVNSITAEAHYLVANGNKGNVEPVENDGEAGKNGEVCPLEIYRSLRDHRPVSTLESTSRFYLQPRSVVHLKGNVPWFTEQGWGKNKLGGLMSDAAQMANLPFSWLRKRRARNYFPGSRGASMQPLLQSKGSFAAATKVIRQFSDEGSNLLSAPKIGEKAGPGVVWLITGRNNNEEGGSQSRRPVSSLAHKDNNQNIPALADVINADQSGSSNDYEDDGTAMITMEEMELAAELPIGQDFEMMSSPPALSVSPQLDTSPLPIVCTLEGEEEEGRLLINEEPESQVKSRKRKNYTPLKCDN